MCEFLCPTPKDPDSINLGWDQEISIFNSGSRLMPIVYGSHLQKHWYSWWRGALPWGGYGTVYLQEGFQEEVILAGLCIEAPKYPLVFCSTVMNSLLCCHHQDAEDLSAALPGLGLLSLLCWHCPLH